MRKILSIFLFLIAGQLQASDQDSVYLDSIKNIEYELEGLSHNIINGEDELTRITSCYYFVQTLKRALQVPGSFDYNFPKIKTVSIIKPKDEAFRIFTWNLLLDSGEFVYFGAMQMNNTDSLVLYGLYDSSKQVKQPEYATTDHRHWMGCLYYQIKHYRYKRQDYYLLFGWDGEDAKSNKKILDVLWFDEEGLPQFGAPVFEVDGDIQNRLLFQFDNEATMLMRYEESEDIIVFANLVPPSPMMEGMYQFYLPDGTYDYLKFEKGIWERYQMMFKGRAKDPQRYRR